MLFAVCFPVGTLLTVEIPIEAVVAFGRVLDALVMAIRVLLLAMILVYRIAVLVVIPTLVTFVVL